VSTQPFPAIHKIGTCWCGQRHNLLQAAELNDPEETLVASGCEDLGRGWHQGEAALTGGRDARDTDLIGSFA
jgi:hypothetical protein